jgi:hypothetical protein
VIRDLRDDTATLEVGRHDGCLVLESVDLELDKRTRERYSSTAGDFRSIRGETRTRRGFSRGDWNVCAETRSILTATPRVFRLHATLDAYEGRERVFSRRWTHEIERALV